MIFAGLVFIGLLAAIVTALRLNTAVDRASRRFRVLIGGYGEARMLVEARRRFRRRQQSVEHALDTGTTGVQAAHRTLAGLFDRHGERDRNSGAGIYDSIRAFNHSVGRAVSGLFAPRPGKRSARLTQQRKTNDDEDAG